MKITCILIDAVNQEIRHHEVEQHSLKDIYDALQCDTFEAVRTPKGGDAIYVDEEGLINGTDYGFTWKNKPLMGNGLVVGTDAEGNTVDCLHKLEEVKYNVNFFKV